MFETYNNYSPPNNLEKKLTTPTAEVALTTPKITRDLFGNILSIVWPEGQDFVLQLPNSVRVGVPLDSIVITNIEHIPDPQNVLDNRYAYNTKNSKCWKGVNGVWVEQDSIFTELSAENIITFECGAKSAYFEIQDFRGNVVYTAQNMELNTAQLSDKIRQGVYTLHIHMLDEDDNETLLTIDISCTGDAVVLSNDHYNEC